MPVTAAPDTIAPTRTASAAPVRDNPLQGALLMIVAAAFFTAMTAMIRHLSTSIDPLELVFFRNFFGLVVLLPWLARNGFGALRTNRLPLLMARTVVGLTAMITWFSAISIMNLGDAVALSFTAPLFATVAAVFILGEVVRARRWTAVIMGFLGAMIILRPGVIEISPVAMMVLVSSMMMGFSVCLVKLLSRTEPVMTMASLIPALFVWTTPTLTELAWMLAIGGCGSLGHICFTRAFSMAEATAILPFDFVRLPMMAGVGWLAFDQVLDIWTGVGAAVIIATTVYIAHREAVHQRQQAEATVETEPRAAD